MGGLAARLGFLVLASPPPLPAAEVVVVMLKLELEAALEGRPRFLGVPAVVLAELARFGVGRCFPSSAAAGEGAGAVGGLGLSFAPAGR